MDATTLDLRYRTKDVLKAVERGETVTVLYRGKEKARIVPIAGRRKTRNIRSDEAFGLWKDREDLRRVRPYVRRLRQGRIGDI